MRDVHFRVRCIGTGPSFRLDAPCGRLYFIFSIWPRLRPRLYYLRIRGAVYSVKFSCIQPVGLKACRDAARM